jgi:hypothetical protein
MRIKKERREEAIFNDKYTQISLPVYRKTTTKR